MSLPSLTPQHKLTYFNNAGWEDEWIDATEQIVRDKYKCSYAQPGDGEETGDEDVVSPICDCLVPTILILTSFLRNLHQTFSTTFQCSQNQNSWGCETSLLHISALIPNMLRMSLPGGMKSDQHIHACHEWHQIIYNSRYVLSIVLSILNALLWLNSYICWCREYFHPWTAFTLPYS